MLKSRFEWTILLVIATLLGAAWIVFSQEDMRRVSAPESLTEAPIVGHLAPDFTLETAVGETVNLQEVLAENGASGQPVVLNFWASWCGPCRVEMPHFQRASMRYNGRVAFLGINQGEDAPTVSDFGNQFNLTYPLLVDQDSEINRLYNVRGLPTTIFVDGDGVVREVVIGIISQGVLEDRIQGMLTE